jgi:geranylgeranyl diphosphate synthase, type II
MNIKEYIAKKRKIIDIELFRLIPPGKGRTKLLCQAMAYALKGGKRIRPILCLSCAETAGPMPRHALKPACAIEMVHTYSLIHDDLPCMDNDDYRRGKLTVHKKFGIAHAVLAGDALSTEAFHVLSCAMPDAKGNNEIIKALSYAAGASGMIAGQAAEIEAEVKDFPAQEYINIHKTGALIAASCRIGAIAAGANEKEIKTLSKFGEYIGLAFQVTDDIIDNEGTAEIAGPKRAFEYAAGLTEAAKKHIQPFGKKANRLCQIADFILNRKI